MMIIKGWIGSDQTALKVDFEVHIDDLLISRARGSKSLYVAGECTNHIAIAAKEWLGESGE